MQEQTAVQFQAPALTLDDFLSIDAEKLDELCVSLTKQNRTWMKQCAPTPDTSWMYVSPTGDIWGHGKGTMTPSTHQLREAAEWVKTPLFLLIRHPSIYCDTTFFFENDGHHRKNISLLFGRSINDCKQYQHPDTGILQLSAQSGLVTKLRKDSYAVGQLRVYKPLIPGTEKGHPCGATVVEIPGMGTIVKFTLHIGSQNKDEVHARGSFVSGEREQDTGKGIQRIERLHRFDDPIIDIFDTYAMKRQRNWMPLILYGPRATYDTRVEPEFRTFDPFPEKYRRPE